MAVKSISKEILIEARLIKRVHDLGGICEKVQAIGARGFFDRLVTLPGGRVIFCEVKKPKGGIVSAHQMQRIETYKKLGATVAIVLSEADIDRVLRADLPAPKRDARGRR